LESWRRVLISFIELWKIINKKFDTSSCEIATLAQFEFIGGKS